MTALRDPQDLMDPIYPESDGQPMGETELHRDEMIELILMLRHRYREASDVCVSGDMFVYYEEGNTSAVFAPDVFVAFGVPKRRRRTYRLWDEANAPTVVVEVTSRGTWLEDAGNKRALCAGLGVAEYFLYDPEHEYLNPPLQGFRLVGADYRAMATRPDGALRSERLGLDLSLDPASGLIQLTDTETGRLLLRTHEVAAELARLQGETGPRES
jgi:Uma2 family endonuclease